MERVARAGPRARAGSPRHAPRDRDAQTSGPDRALGRHAVQSQLAGLRHRPAHPRVTDGDRLDLERREGARDVVRRVVRVHGGQLDDRGVHFEPAQGEGAGERSRGHGDPRPGHEQHVAPSLEPQVAQLGLEPERDHVEAAQGGALTDRGPQPLLHQAPQGLLGKQAQNQQEEPDEGEHRPGGDDVADPGPWGRGRDEASSLSIEARRAGCRGPRGDGGGSRGRAPSADRPPVGRMSTLPIG